MARSGQQAEGEKVTKHMSCRPVSPEVVEYSSAIENANEKHYPQLQTSRLYGGHCTVGTANEFPVSTDRQWLNSL